MRNKVADIYNLIGRIPVSGDAVDIMAAARSELRALHREIQKQEVDEKAVSNAVMPDMETEVPNG